METFKQCWGAGGGSQGAGAESLAFWEGAGAVLKRYREPELLNLYWGSQSRDGKNS